jgi:tetratricopeptide (TPR) repeat protein
VQSVHEHCTMTLHTSGEDTAPHCDSGTSIESGLRVADALVRLGDRTRAFGLYLQVAQRYTEQGRLLEAAAIGFRALAVHPESFTSARVTSLLRELGDAAIPLCRRSIRAHLEADRPEAAMSMAEVMLVLDPNDCPARRELAQLYVQTERREDAIALLESTIRRLAEAGRDRDLIATARLLLRLEPAHPPTLRKLTHACLRLGQASAALAASTRLVAVAPSDAEAVELLASVYIELDRPAEALHALGRLTDAMSQPNGPEQLERVDLVLVRALTWVSDPGFHRGVAALRARAHARARSTPGSPLALVPDAPELLEAPRGACDGRPAQ